jgi:abhydrolase domain-containing protein 17
MTTGRYVWRIVRGPLRLVVLAYLVLLVAAPLLAPSKLFYPHLASRAAPEGLRVLKTPGGGALAVWHLPNPAARFTLWVFHGNAESLADIEPWLRDLHRAGFAVFAADYPGYGRSDGEPSENTIYGSTRVAREFLRGELKVAAADTILYGRSLGGGPAVQAATEERVAGLVLQGAFTSVFRVVTRWPLLPFDQFRNASKLPRVAAPVLVMHGGRDEVIPFAHGEALFAAARGPRQHLWVAAAGHNDFVRVAGDAYWAALRDFSALCARTVPASP